MLALAAAPAGRPADAPVPADHLRSAPFEVVYAADPPSEQARQEFADAVSSWCETNLASHGCLVVWTFQTLRGGERFCRAYSLENFTRTASRYARSLDPDVPRYFSYDLAAGRGAADWLNANGRTEVYAPTGDLGRVIGLLNHAWADPCSEEFIREMYALSPDRVVVLAAVLEHVQRVFATPQPRPDWHLETMVGDRADVSWDDLGGIAWHNLEPHLARMGLWELSEADQRLLIGLARTCPSGSSLEELLDLLAAAQA